jgi:hypothetical protein
MFHHYDGWVCSQLPKKTWLGIGLQHKNFSSFVVALPYNRNQISLCQSALSFIVRTWIDDSILGTWRRGGRALFQSALCRNSRMQCHKWVVLVAGSIGSALAAELFSAIWSCLQIGVSRP